MNFLIVMGLRSHTSEPLSCAAVRPHLPNSVWSLQPPLSFSDLLQKHLERRHCLHSHDNNYKSVASLWFLLVHHRWELNLLLNIIYIFQCNIFPVFL